MVNRSVGHRYAQPAGQGPASVVARQWTRSDRRSLPTGDLFRGGVASPIQQVCHSLLRQVFAFLQVLARLEGETPDQREVVVGKVLPRDAVPPCTSEREKELLV